MVELARARPQFDFHIVGATHAGLLSGQGRPNLPFNLKIHGYQPHRVIPSYLLAFDVALLPNQPIVRLENGSRDTGQWTSPLKLFEYVAAGRAIICSDVSVLQEVANDGVNMLVCRYDDVSDWASALDRLHSNPNLRKSLGEVARRQLESLYSCDRRVSYLLHLVPVSGKS